MSMDDVFKLLEERQALSDRLTKALAHLPIREQIFAISSFIPLDELKEMVAFQERSH